LQSVNNATAVFTKGCIKTTEYEPYIVVIIIEIVWHYSEIMMTF